MESGKTVYETMGEFCEHWGESVMGKYGYSGVGAVVGALVSTLSAAAKNKMEPTARTEDAGRQPTPLAMEPATHRPHLPPRPTTTAGTT